jgi:hypothetical protein
VRDENGCLITGAGFPVDVAHICPLSMRTLQPPTDTSIENPWSVLRLFWAETRVNSWYNAITTDSGAEIVANLLTLAPHAYAYHRRAYFALQPQKLSEEKRHLTVGFHWIPEISKLPKRIDILTKAEISNNLDMSGIPGRCVKLFCVQNDQKICSGDEITFKTEDPEKMPLPSCELLDMHWVLQRLSALAGAAEVEDDIIESDDGSNSPGPFQEWMDDSYSRLTEGSFSIPESQDSQSFLPARSRGVSLP